MTDRVTFTTSKGIFEYNGAEAHELRQALDAALRSYETKQLEVVVEHDGDETVTYLVCGHCGHRHFGDDGPVCVDIAERWNDGQMSLGYNAVFYHYDTSSEFNGDRFQCSACSGTVELPDDWTEEGM